MGEVVVIPDIYGLPDAPAVNHHLGEINQRDTEHQQGLEDGKRVRIIRSVKMRQDCHHRQQVTREVAAGVPEKGFGCGIIVRQKAEQRSTGEESDQGDQYWPSAEAITAKFQAAMAPKPAQSPFMLSMKLKALMIVSIHRTVTA